MRSIVTVTWDPEAAAMAEERAGGGHFVAAIFANASLSRQMGDIPLLTTSKETKLALLNEIKILTMK